MTSYVMEDVLLCETKREEGVEIDEVHNVWEQLVWEVQWLH